MRGAAKPTLFPEASTCARKHGISSATFYAWKAKYNRMDVSEAENIRLKRLLADAMLDNAIVRDVAGKNV
jgi:putative transposase